jgi:hypothetical protein
MNGAVPPLPQYAFMAWCSVKISTEGGWKRLDNDELCNMYASLDINGVAK